MPNRSTSAWRRRVAVVSVGGLLALVAPAFVAAPAGAAAPVPFEQADFAGYGAGSLAHVGAVTLGTTQVAKADVAPANALVASKGLGPVNNTYGLPINRTKTGGFSTNKADANASAVSAGLVAPPTTGGNINLTALAAAEAPPPSTDMASVPVNLAPLASATLLHSTAHANYLSSNQCFLGGNLTDAEADATNLSVLGLVQSSGVSKNISSTRLVPQTNKAGVQLGNAFGLASMNTQVLAPVNIGVGVAGVPSLATISLTLGQFALEAAATGVPGGAFTSFGPTPGQSGGATVATITLAGAVPIVIKLSDIVGPNGFDTATLGNGALNGLLRLQIGGPGTSSVAANGTTAAASANIVHLTVLNAVPGLQAADVFLGHLEATARVPDGGIACSLHPTKTATPDPVTAGQNFVYTLGAPNPNACILRNVRFTDVISAPKGIRFTVGQTIPQAASISPITTDPQNPANNIVTVVFTNTGDIPPGGTGQAKIMVNIDPSSGTGTFVDTLDVVGTCAVGAAGGSNAVINLAVPGRLVLTAPRVGAGAAQGPLPRTGGTNVIYLWLSGLGLLGFVVVDQVRRRVARSTE